MRSAHESPVVQLVTTRWAQENLASRGSCGRRTCVVMQVNRAQLPMNILRHYRRSSPVPAFDGSITLASSSFHQVKEPSYFEIETELEVIMMHTQMVHQTWPYYD